MSALEILPRVDAAVHADTTWERSETYDFAKRWTPWLEERGVRVVTVSDYSAVKKILNTLQVHIPLYTVSKKNGSYGVLRRTCTQRWKIAPIRRWLQANRNGKLVEQWIGITFDEIERMKQSNVKYAQLIYPFINSFPYPMTRYQVIEWLKSNDLEVPVKSGCVFCPYHDRETWRAIQKTNHDDWKLACEMDSFIRNKRPGYDCYLTSKKKSLIECDFGSPEEHGQLNMFNEDCSGHCFL